MKLHLPPGIEQDLREAISKDDFDRFGELASPLKWGKPSWSASQILLQVLDADENSNGYGRQVSPAKKALTSEGTPQEFSLRSGTRTRIRLGNSSQLSLTMTTGLSAKELTMRGVSYYSITSKMSSRFFKNSANIPQPTSEDAWRLLRGMRGT